MKTVRIITLGLLFVYPFLKFVAYNQYPFFSPEVLLPIIVLSGLAALLGRPEKSFPFSLACAAAVFVMLTTGPFTIGPPALFARGGIALAVFLFLLLVRRKAPVMALLFILATIVSGAVIRGETREAERPESPAQSGPPPGASTEPQTILYLILDEQIGIDGMPQSVDETPVLQENLRTFYLGNGFTLFSKAYSTYFYSDNAISNILNGTFSDRQGFYFDGGPDQLLKTNRLFEHFGGEGFRIHSYAFDYIDYCTDRVSRCYRYRKNSPVNLLGLGYSLRERLRVLGTGFLATNSVFKEIHKRIPDRGLFPVKVGPLGVVPALFEKLEKDLRAARGSNLFFVHVAMPHYPYVYDAECRPKRVAEWLSRNEFNEAHRKNTPDGYAKRYAAYYEQVECLHRLLGNLFQGLKESGTFDGMTIIVHGDHGSRIQLDHEPYYNYANRISPDDLITGHSTLLAFKGPNQTAGLLDQRQGSVTAILNDVLYAGKAFAGEPEPFVLMKQKKGKKELIRHPMPRF